MTLHYIGTNLEYSADDCERRFPTRLLLSGHPGTSNIDDKIQRVRTRFNMVIVLTFVRGSPSRSPKQISLEGLGSYRTRLFLKQPKEKPRRLGATLYPFSPKLPPRSDTLTTQIHPAEA